VRTGARAPAMKQLRSIGTAHFFGTA